MCARGLQFHGRSQGLRRQQLRSQNCPRLLTSMVFQTPNSKPYAQELFNDPPRTNIYVGDQSDREGWARFRRQMAEEGVSFDVILDDGAAPNPE